MKLKAGYCVKVECSGSGLAIYKTLRPEGISMVEDFSKKSLQPQKRSKFLSFFARKEKEREVFV